MDNTYFAVKTYDILAGGDWSLKSAERTELITFIDGLQSNYPGDSKKGGFYNNEYTDYENFDTMFSNSDPNLVSSFYCMKTLELFGGADPYGTIDPDDFKSYLG